MMDRALPTGMLVKIAVLSPVDLLMTPPPFSHK